MWDYYELLWIVMNCYDSNNQAYGKTFPKDFHLQKSQSPPSLKRKKKKQKNLTIYQPCLPSIKSNLEPNQRKNKIVFLMNWFQLDGRQKRLYSLHMNTRAAIYRTKEKVQISTIHKNYIHTQNDNFFFLHLHFIELMGFSLNWVAKLLPFSGWDARFPYLFEFFFNKWKCNSRIKFLN